jgi:hypothetical protein
MEPIPMQGQSSICTAKKFEFMYPRKGNCVASVPISTFMCLWAIYIYDLYIPKFGPHIFLQQNRQTDQRNIKIAPKHMNVKLGLESPSSFPGHICFEFSVLCKYYEPNIHIFAVCINDFCILICSSSFLTFAMCWLRLVYFLLHSRHSS